MSSKALRDELSKGLRGPSYMLYADDPFLLNEALSEIRAALPDEAMADFNYYEYDIESPDPLPPVEQLVDVLNTVSFMGGRKTVIIKNTQKLKVDAQKAIGAYLKKPSPDSLLVLTFHIKSERAAERSSKVKKLTDAYAGAKLIELRLRESEFPSWVIARAKSKGVAIALAEAALLVEFVGHDLGLLASEVEKLSLLGKPTVGRADVAAMVRGAGDYNAFNLTDALSQKNLAQAIKICRKLTQTDEPIAVLGALNWYYGRQDMTPKRKRKVYTLLCEADKLIRSSGGAYPLELLVVKLLSA